MRFARKDSGADGSADPRRSRFPKLSPRSPACRRPLRRRDPPRTTRSAHPSPVRVSITSRSADADRSADASVATVVMASHDIGAATAARGHAHPWRALAALAMSEGLRICCREIRSRELTLGRTLATRDRHTIAHRARSHGACSTVHHRAVRFGEGSMIWTTCASMRMRLRARRCSS